MSVNKIIEQGDKILADLSELDDRLFRKASDYLRLFSNQGIIDIPVERLAEMEDVLYKEVKDSNYEETLQKYMALFTKLYDSINQEQVKLNKLKIQELDRLWGDSKILDKTISKVVNDLGKQGVSKVLVKAVADAVREADYYNMDLKSAEDKLRSLIKPKDATGLTERYVGQVARDSLSQMDGAFQDKVRKTYGFKTLVYIGNTIETSRPICAHIMNDLNGRVSETQLKQILNEYCPNGQPSDTKITYETQNGKTETAKKGAGMIEATTPENFSTLRGGYNCRHRALWVR